MSKSNSSFTSLVIFGAVTGVSLLALMGWYFWGKKKKIEQVELPAQSKLLVEDIVEDALEKVEDNEVEVEDINEEEDNSEAIDEAQLKSSYDDALKMAKKLLGTGEYSSAANKFTEAIILAYKIPSAENDLVVLYNNRRYKQTKKIILFIISFL